MNEQNHPLYSVDRDHIDRLLAKADPEDGDIVDLARLLLRYEGFPGAIDLKEDMVKTLKCWGLTSDELNTRTRELWRNGYRPGHEGNSSVGSGFDTSDNPAD